MEDQPTTSFKQDFENLKKNLKSKIFKPEAPKTTVPFTMPKQKMEPALKKAVEKGDAKQATFIALSQSSIIRGGLVGAILTSLIGFNAGKYSRLGAIRKRMRFIHNFIRPNKRPQLMRFTNYFYPNLRTVTKNILCFSGEQGIGKSYHFQNIAYTQSQVRPALYVSFKASGKNNTFEEDIAKKLDYGEGQNPPMLSQIINAVRKIHQINTKPYKVWGQLILATMAYGWISHSVMVSELLDANEGLILGMLGTSYAYYLYMMYPFLLQSLRKTRALVIFDDVNKIDKIGQLAEISRFLQLHEQDMGNVVLISSDEQTWFKLRKEPGLKDRLRQRVIIYNHSYTAKQMVKYLEDDRNFKEFAKKGRVNPLFTKQLVIGLIQDLIGQRQATIRRIKSILILNDQQQYQEFLKVLTDYQAGQLSLQKAINQITQILYSSETETLCAKLKHIKRQINMGDQQFIKQMKTLLQRGKLLSDNKLGPFLMSYNIVRDSQSEYVFNGKFMYTVFEMAYKQYIKNLQVYHQQKTGYLQSDTKFDSNVANREEQQKKRTISQQNKDDSLKTSSTKAQ